MVRHMLNDSQLFLCFPRRILPQDKIAFAIAEFNGDDTDCALGFNHLRLFKILLRRIHC